MKTLKLSTLVLTFTFGAWLGCSGGSSNNGTSGSLSPSGAGGKGGASGMGGTVDAGGMGGTIDASGLGGTIDAGATDTPSAPEVPVDASGSEASSLPGALDCTGLTPEQCHDHIINPPSLPDGVLPQDPGANPTVPYPNCSSM